MKGVVPSNHRRGGWVSKKVSKLTKVRGCELANRGDNDVGVNCLFFVRMEWSAVLTYLKGACCYLSFFLSCLTKGVAY